MTNTILLENAKKLKEVAEKYGVKLPVCFQKEEEKFSYSGIMGYKLSYEKVNLYDEYELSNWIGGEITIKTIIDKEGKTTYFAHRKEHNYVWVAEANTPQGALCLLAIELIRKGIIK